LFFLRGSASPPPLEAASLPRGMVTMRCDITTCSSSHVSLLVSGSAQTCFDDQVHISISSYFEAFLVLNTKSYDAYYLCSF
jgi:hypothetical protein